MKLPNFLIIGVQKAGTTSIYNYLKQHPEIYMSPVKETNFLAKDWDAMPPEEMAESQINTLEKYVQLFAGVKDEIAIGEVSPNYLLHYQASCRNIVRYVPDVKMIAILRDPAERAYSDYIMRVRDAREPRSLLEQIKYSSHKSDVLLKGFYYTPLKYYLDQFGWEKIKIYLYEDLCQDPITMMQDIYRFLGVDDTFLPDTSKKAQVGAVPKVKFWNDLLQQRNPLRLTVGLLLKPLLPVSLRQNIRSRLIKINLENKRNLSPQERKELVELYREDIGNLQELIQRDLSQWLEY